MSTRERWCVQVLYNVYEALWNFKVEFRHYLLFLMINIKTEQEPQDLNLDPTFSFTEDAKDPPHSLIVD